MAIFPQNGRVLIIDDQIDEAKPLMKILSKNEVKYSFFSGMNSENPSKKMEDIRLIFLDLQLHLPGKTPDPNSDVKDDIQLLRNLISPKNSMYILLIWSKNIETDHGTIFKEMIKTEKMLPLPLKIIELDKNDYFETDLSTGKLIPKGEEKEILRLIQREITTQISEQHFFHIFTYWDNIINKSSNEIINSIFNSISKLDTTADINNKKMWALIYELAEAKSGQKFKATDKKCINDSLSTFCGIFFDTVEKNLINSTYPCPLLPLDQTVDVDAHMKGIINKKLLTSDEDLKCEPGTIYAEEDADIKKAIINDGINREALSNLFCESLEKNRSEVFIKKNKPKTEFKMPFEKFEETIKSEINTNSALIFCEVTPGCDYSQNRVKMNRVIYGITWPYKFENLIPQNSNFLYKSAVMELDGKLNYLVFDFGFLHGKKETDFNGKTPILRLRHEILVDIQSRLAAHVHRPGVTSLQ
jgi:hypothetical protein